MAGVTAEGFVAKTVEELKAEIEAEQLETIDPSLVLAPDQPIGQINAIVSKKLAEVWELAAVAFNAFNREAAEDFLLDNVGSLTGTPREESKKSLVTCTLDLDAAFSAAAGTLMANVTDEETIQFVNRDEVTSTTAGEYDVVFESVEYGPVNANAGTLEQITNPVTGWNSITNDEDAVPGALVEEDSPYRQRQIDELTATGSSTVDAIRADVLKVPGVEQCYVFENVTLITDENGLPGKAIEVVIYDGSVPAADDTAIAQAIWDSKPSGSETYGTEQEDAVDPLGIDRPMKFSRATLKNVYLEFDLVVNPKLFPVNGATLVKEAAVARGNMLNLGDDVIDLVIAASALSVPGVIDVTELRLGFTASPVGTTNLTITGREIARFDTSRIVVSV